MLAASSVAADYSLRFFGNGSGDIDRVKIPLDNPHRSIDVGDDFTIEFWIKAQPGENTGSVDCSSTAGGDRWITGNTIFDRDIYGAGDFGDYGISLGGGRIIFGIDAGPGSITICGSTVIADGSWRHVAAVRRRSDGRMRIFVDGVPDATGNGGTGGIGYRDNRVTKYPNSDPFLVIGAEKHDAGPNYPSFKGWIDEIRISNTARYDAAFPRPAFHPIEDANTVALFHFLEGSGDFIGDTAGANHGVRRFGGLPAQGPQWTIDSVFNQGMLTRFISGRLRRADGTPVADTIVRIEFVEDPGTFATATTDSDGRYFFVNLPTTFAYSIRPSAPRSAFRPARHIVFHTDNRNDVDFAVERRRKWR